MKIKAKLKLGISGVTNGKLYKVIDKYDKGYLIINDNGVAVKIHRNNCEVINGHPHAELIMKYAEIAQHDAEPWKHFEFKYDGKWVDLDFPLAFNVESEYRLKPRTININGFEVHEPLRHELSDGTDYYVYETSKVKKVKWQSDDLDYKWLKAGIIHLTREAAEKHLEALLSFTKE